MMANIHVMNDEDVTVRFINTPEGGFVVIHLGEDMTIHFPNFGAANLAFTKMIGQQLIDAAVEGEAMAAARATDFAPGRIAPADAQPF